MKKLVVTLLAAFSCLASGATINLGGAPAARLGVAPAGGGALLVGAGSYFITAGGYSDAPTDFASALSGFTPLRDVSDLVVTVASAANATPGQPSLIGGSFVGVGPGALSGTAVYFLISNTSDYTTATQLAVVRSSATLFPNPVSGAGTVSATSSLAGLVSVVGGFTDAPTGNDFVTMVAVPEPSVALLGVLGVLGFVRRRR